ncbi:hypothetical protein ACFOS0_34245 [Nocardia seriolae]|uniref:hypothetical protein n=1 Tax=Nocardia seriolae TaxID=37332 RepID=UPI001190EDFC|nr:hypothetical protein [Nocardia seriolae]GEM26162.1 hypothetical protein NS2_44010 [Nocardia seriolae NBRC 15557]
MDDAERTIIVDAANVVGSRPDGWWRDRAGAARRLLDGLAALRTRLPETTSLIVVLEGAAKAAADGTEYEGVRIVLAAGSGDGTIVEVTATELETACPPREVTAVTADRGLRARVEPLGASTLGPSWLLSQLP